MRRLFQIVFLASSIAYAQIPVPQIGLTGNIGCQGFPCVNSGTLVMSLDVDHYMTVQETSAQYIKVTSSVSLTATRNLVAPSGKFNFTIQNATTGGQSIQIIGSSGTGITITNGSTVGVWNDGTNFVQIGVAGGSGTVNSGATGQVAYYPSSGSAVSGTSTPSVTTISAGHVIGNSSTPTAAVGAAAGSGATISMTCSGSAISCHSTDAAGGFFLATGTGATTGVVATITWNVAYTASPNCSLSFIGMAVPTGLNGALSTGTSTTGMTIYTNTALTSSSSYTIGYMCIQ